jgi:hypothetical protein
LKTTKLMNLIAAVTIAAFTLTFTSCTLTPLCACPVKGHLGVGENCDCDDRGCDCELKVYGTVVGIPVYRGENVTDEQAQTAADNVLDGDKKHFWRIL